MSENTRTQISIHLTKILVLFGRLNPEYNPRQLPLSVHLILIHLRELEQLDAEEEEFKALFRESVEIRENYTKVFVIPVTLLNNPTLEGLKQVISELVDPLVYRYCVEEKKALSAEVDGSKHPDDIRLMLSRTRENCRLLQSVSRTANAKFLQELQSWCESGLDRIR
jgi:very-short-patch-repair endonuclease